jgi:putative PEP-CTERM system TPR-repeat lipoprotein
VSQAAAALDTARQQNAEPAAISTLTGLVKVAQLDLDGGRAAFEDALRANPESGPARLNLAKVLSLQGQSAQAARLIEEGLAKQPADLALLGTVVPMLLAQQETGRAIAVVEAAHAAAPANTGLTTALAELYVRTGTPSKAIDLLDREPGASVGKLAARALALQALNQPKDAASAYRQLLQSAPADLAARRQLVALLMAANDAPGAKATLQEGLAATPGSLPLLGTLVSVTAKADGIEAGLALAARLEQDPANLPAAQLLAGDLDMSAGRFAAAAAAFAAEFRKAPSAILAQRVSVAWNAAGAPDRAMSVLQDWVTQHQDDFGMTVSLAGQQLANGDFVAAEGNLNKVLAARPNDAGALNNLAWLYQQRGDPRARAMAQKAYLIAPQPQTADTLGWILASSGDPSAALPLLRQAAAQMRNNPAVQYHLAAALKDAGHGGEALTVMRALPAGGFLEKPQADRLLLQLAPP